MSRSSIRSLAPAYHEVVAAEKERASNHPPGRRPTDATRMLLDMKISIAKAARALDAAADSADALLRETGRSGAKEKLRVALTTPPPPDDEDELE